MWRVSKSVVCAALLVPAVLGAVGPREEVSVEGVGGRLWIKNLDDRAVNAVAGGEEIRLEKGAMVEAPAMAARVRSGGDVFLLRAGEGFDPASVAFEGTPAVRWERVKGKDVMYVIRPEWAQSLLGASRDKGSLLAGGRAGRAFPGLGTEPTSEVGLSVAVDLVEAGSSVEVVLRGSKGEVLKSLTASSSKPVRWQADLGRFFGNDLGEESRVELKVLRGSARGILSTLVDGKPGPGQPILEKAGGSGFFNYAVNWQTTSALYYTVSSGPANTCGDLYTFRNGSWVVGGGWLCTNASGYAYKGPWTWAGTPSDQTDKPAYIRWPDGTQTTPDDHVWDKTCATTSRTSPAYSNAVPLSYYGNATDAPWGAGFTNSWTLARSYFEDRTNPASILYWSPSTGSYNAARTGVAPSLSGMPAMTAYWNQTTFPSVGAHVSGHTYRWQTCVDDGHCTQCADTTFTAP
jgi:hypothetical protein